MDLDPVGTIMAWISTYGLIGLFAVALSERFVPVMPSYGLFLAVGIAAADGAWSLPSALVATITGSIFGCASWFYAARGLGNARSMRLLNATGRLFGMPSDRIGRGIASFRRNQAVLAFSLQLVPTVRLFAPAFAALLDGNARHFLISSAAGISIWNSLFISIGFYVSHSMAQVNTTLLAFAALGGLIVAEAAVFWIARRVRALRKPDAALCAI